jgi:hypothetical protein
MDPLQQITPDSPDELSFPDTEQNIVEPIHSMQTNYRKGTSTIQRKTLLAGIIPSLVAILLVASFIGWRIMTSQNSEQVAQNNTDPSTNVNLSGLDLSVESLTNAERLVVGGELNVSDILKVAGVSTFESQTSFLEGISVAGDVEITGNLVVRGTINESRIPSDLPQNQIAGPRGTTGPTGPQGLSGPSGSPGACTYGSCLSLQGSNPGIQEAGNINISGSITAGNLVPNSLASVLPGFDTTTVVANTAYTSGPNVYSAYNDASPWTIVGNDGLLRIVWIDWGNYELNYVRCQNIECDSSITTVIDSSLNGFDGASIALDSSGNPYIFYIEYTSPSIAKLAHCLDQDCVNSTLEIIDTSHEWHYVTSISMGNDELPRLTFERYYDPNEIYYVRCQDVSCSTNTITLLDSSVGGLAYFEPHNIIIGGDGFARIVYRNQFTREVHLIRCLDDDCIVRTNTVVGSSVNYGVYNLYGSDDLLRIVYGTNNGDGIKIVTCNDDDCVTRTTTTVKSSLHDVVDVALDSNDNITILGVNEPDPAYSRALYYIRCMNNSCDQNTVTLIDPEMAYYASLSIDNNGLSQIVYMDSDSTRSIKLARLSNQDGRSTVSGVKIGTLNEPYAGIYTNELRLMQSDQAGLVSDRWTLSSDFSVSSNLLFKNELGNSVLSVTQNGDLELDGSLKFNGSLEISGVTSSQGSVNRYTNLTSRYDGLNPNTDSSTGAFVVKTNIDATNRRWIRSLVVQFYGYSNAQLNNRYDLSFYTYNGVGFFNYGYTKEGKYAPPIRIGVDSNNKVIIIIGDENSVFPYGSFHITELFSNNITLEEAKGWTMSSRVTDFSEYSYLTTLNEINDEVSLTPNSSTRNRIQPQSPSYIPLTIRGAVSQTADLFQVQNSSGAVLSRINSLGDLTVVNGTFNGRLTVNGKVVTANTSGSTTAAVGANAGAGATISVAGNDTSGTVTITTGTGSATGVLGTVTFSSAYSATPRIVMTPANANGSTLQYFYNATTGNFTIRTNNAPVDATQYQFTYWAVQ